MLFRSLTNHSNKQLSDLKPREWAYLLPLVVLIFAMGLVPQPLLDRINPSVEAFLARVEAHYDQSPYASGENLPAWLRDAEASTKGEAP